MQFPPLQAAYAPYADPSLNRLELISLGTTLATLYAALFLAQPGASTAHAALGDLVGAGGCHADRCVCVCVCAGCWVQALMCVARGQ